MKDFATPILDAVREKRLTQGAWNRDGMCCLVSSIYPECRRIEDIPAEFMPKRWAGFIVTIFDEITNLISRVERFANASKNLRYMYTDDFNQKFVAELRRILAPEEGSIFEAYLSEKQHKYVGANKYSFWAVHRSNARAANMIWDSFCTLLEKANAQASS